MFITEHDVMSKGKPLCRIGRYIFDTGENFDDSSHILHVNGEYREEAPIGKLEQFSEIAIREEIW